jgi:hypothetical protein
MYYFTLILMNKDIEKLPQEDKALIFMPWTI